MTGTKELGSMIDLHWGGALRYLHASEKSHGSKMEFGASVNELARHLLEIPGNTAAGLINTLAAGTIVNPKILEMYINILRGMDALPEVEVLPTGAFLLPIPGSNIIIGPKTAVDDTQNVHIKLYTTPTGSENSLPLLAEFTGEGRLGKTQITFNNRLLVNGLMIECTDFKCDVFADGISLGRVDLLEAYAEQVRAIKDKHAYMDAWDIHINDYLHRVQDAVKSARVLLDMERQHYSFSAEEDPAIVNRAPFRRVFSPLIDVTMEPMMAFAKSSIMDTVESQFIRFQIAKINNVMMIPLLVIDSKPNRLKQSSVMEAIHVLESLFDPADHLRMTYECTNLWKNGKLNVEASNTTRMELDNPIAVRRLLDEIIYQVMLHQAEDTSKLSFKLDEPQRLIDVSYERPQPESLVDALNGVASRHKFTGSIDYRWSENKITGLRIMDQAPAGPADEDLGNDDVRGGSTSSLPPKLLNMPYGRTAPVFMMMFGAQAMIRA